MNVERLKKQIISDEGCKFHIYTDTEGKPTFGIGHLITKNDPEFGIKINTPVPHWRVNDCFDADLDNAIDACENIFPKFNQMDFELKEILANMAFNLGQKRLSGFKKMIAAIEAKDYLEAAKQMKNSRWFEQVPNRAGRLINRMVKLAKKS